MLETRQKIGWSGFTLIELLIVVAIIAILAAIAVPNFLEAQTRSKVSRTAADLRSLRTGLESYYVDNNKYPETDTGQANLYAPGNGGFGLLRLTTPIAYMTSVPKSPFKEEKIGFANNTLKNCNRMVSPLYVRAKLNTGDTDTIPAGGDGKNDDYNKDRSTYLGGNSLAFNNAGGRSAGEWMMKSVGPDNIDDRDASDPIVAARTGKELDARVYDPTNGTVSAGDLVIFSDTQGFAQQK